MDHVCFQIGPWKTTAAQEQLRGYEVELGDVEHGYAAPGVGPSIYLKDYEGNNVELNGIARRTVERSGNYH